MKLYVQFFLLLFVNGLFLASNNWDIQPFNQKGFKTYQNWKKAIVRSDLTELSQEYQRILGVIIFFKLQANRIEQQRSSLESKIVNIEHAAQEKLNKKCNLEQELKKLRYDQMEASNELINAQQTKRKTFGRFNKIALLKDQISEYRKMAEVVTKSIQMLDADIDQSIAELEKIEENPIKKELNDVRCLIWLNEQASGYVGHVLHRKRKSKIEAMQSIE